MTFPAPAPRHDAGERTVIALHGSGADGSSMTRAAARFVDCSGGASSFAALPAKVQQRVAPRMGKVGTEFATLSADAVPTADVAALRVPLRLLVGSASPAPAQRVAEQLAMLCAGATLQRLPGAGHLAPLNELARATPWPPLAGAMRRPPAT